jgi:uncharacterized membrane protein
MRNLIDTLFFGANGAFIWADHVTEIIMTALLSMVPLFEGRYALVTAQAMGMPAIPAYLIAVLFSSIPVPIILWLLRPVLDWMYTWPIGFVRKIAAWVDERGERKKGKVDKLGLWGLYLFVALPLPGTGAWTGSAIATALKMDKKSALMVIIAGNFTACLITTVLTYMGISLFA